MNLLVFLSLIFRSVFPPLPAVMDAAVEREIEREPGE